MMNFIEIAKKRYSVRNYSSKKVEKEKLDKILQAAHVAPTAANLQPVHLIAVESKEGLEKISKGANIYNAPLAIIVCADHNKAWVRPFDQKQTGDIDAAILTDHMMLEATELGLGTVSVFLQRSTRRLQKCRLPVLLSVCSEQGNRSRERNAVPLWSSSATQPKSLTRTDSAEPEPALSCFHK